MPERLARAMIGTTSRTVRDAAKVVVPDAFKGGRLYDITVQKMLGFLADDVGRLKPSGDKDNPEADAKTTSGEDDQFVVKKAVGNVIDIAGLSVMHVSPLWVIAIFSDVALGARSYLNALVDELRQQGVIDESDTIENVDGLLDALQKTSGTLADGLDTPPVTVDQLRAMVAQLREQSQTTDLASLVPIKDIERVWNEIQDTVRLEGRSLFEVSNAVAMMTFTQMVRAGKTAHGAAKVALDLIDDNFIDYYATAFRRIHEKGYYESVLESYDAFVDDLRHLFDASAETTTEKVVRGRWLQRLWGRMKQRFQKSEAGKPSP